LYGFQRIAKGSEAGRYKHEQFMRGRPEAAAQIRREAKDEQGNRVRPGGFSGRSSGGGFGGGGAGGDDNGGSDGDDAGDDYLASLRAQPPRPGGRSGTRGHSHAAMASHQGSHAAGFSQGHGERSLRHAPSSSRRSFGSGGGAARDDDSHSPEAQPRYAPDPEAEAEDDRSAALAMLNIARSLSTESLKPEPLSPPPNESDEVGTASAAGSSSSGLGEGGFSVGGGSFCEDRIDLVAALNASKSREAELSAQVERLQSQVASLEAALRAPTPSNPGAVGEPGSAAAAGHPAHAPLSDGASEEDEEKGGDSDSGSSAGEKRRWRMDTNDDHSEASDDHPLHFHHSGAGAIAGAAKGDEARKRAKEERSGSPPPSPGDSSGSAGSMPSPLSSRSTSDRCLSPAMAEPSATAQAAGQ